jgi:hypothetical protein
MTPELERAVKRYRQWFGSYKKSGELIKVQVWLTINNGCIEFLTLDDSYKVSAYGGTRARFAISAIKKALRSPVLPRS